MSEVATSVTYKRLRRYAKPYWGLIGIGMLAMALEAAASAGTLKLLGPIVDRIGGGDAFAAGVLHGLIKGWAPERTIRFGLAAGCLKHSVPGDFNLVSEADVEALVGEGRFDVKR